jgi:predicted DNA-binding protein
MFYLPPEQAGELDSLARKRSIPKAALVRFAITKMLRDMSSGQLELPLGIE